MARLITLFALFALWEIGGGRLFDTFYFSKPSLIAKAFAVEVADPLFYRDLATTGLELILLCARRRSRDHARHPACPLAFCWQDLRSLPAAQ